MRTIRENTELLNRCVTEGSPGRTPWILFINFPLIASVTGVKSSEYFHDPQTMTEAQAETFRKLGTDGPLSPDFGTVAEASAYGGRVVYDREGIPSIQPDPGPETADLIPEAPTDPRTSGLMARQLEFLAYMAAHCPPGMEVASCNMMAPLTAAATLRGISDFCVDVIEEPEAVAELTDRITQTEIASLEEQRRILGGRMKRVLLSDDISSFLSAGQFEALVRPIYDRIYGAFPEAQRWLHNDGNAAHLAPSISRAGIQLWHVGKNMDMGKLFDLTEGRVALCGNLNPVTELLHLKPEEVKKRAQEEVKRYQERGKHILSTGGFISYGTAIDAILAMMEGADSVH